MTTSPPDLSSLRIDRRDPPPSRGRGRWVAIAVILVALAVGVAVWRPGFSGGPEVRVGLATATGGGTVSAGGITANGYVVARTKASVSAKIPGRMIELAVSEGSVVRRGQILARLEGAEYAAAVNAAKAAVARTEVELAQAKRELERTRSLRRENVVSEADLENATARVDGLEAQVAAGRAEVQLAEATLENTYVRAPFSGTVLRKAAEGATISPTSSAGGGLTRTAIVTMADLGTLEVEVDVNEAYIAQVRNGQPSRITLDAYPDTSFAGRVRQVVPTADRQKATVQVKVSILDRDPRILPEMGAKVTFERESDNPTAAAARRVLVPRGAVAQGTNGARVWIVEQGRVSSREVEVGPERGEQVEIRRGLSGGETVVLDPPGSLEDGARVRVATS